MALVWISQTRSEMLKTIRVTAVFLRRLWKHKRHVEEKCYLPTTSVTAISLLLYPQIFVVRRDVSQKPMVLSVRLPDQKGEPQVKELHVKEEKSCESFCLQNMILHFQHCC